MSINKKTFRSFTLAETLITLAIIGVVAAITIPALVQSNQEQQIVSGLKKFNSTLNQAVQLWKQDIGCYDSASSCLAAQNLSDNVASNFDQLVKYFKIAKSTRTTTDKSWLPDDTLNYYGNSAGSIYGRVAKIGCGSGGCFLLQDGTTIAVDTNPAGFDISVDVNGKKPPNRIGKDTFVFYVGNNKGRDVYEYPHYPNSTDANTLGLCGNSNYCSPNNADPTKDNGASPTSYVLLNGKLPDFNALSQTVPGMKP